MSMIARPTELAQTDAMYNLVALFLFHLPDTTVTVGTLKATLLAVQQEAWDAGYARGRRDATSVTVGMDAAQARA